MNEVNKIKIGISACLLGQEVRFDGGSLKPALINKKFAEYFSYVPFCPEVGIGMGVPRESIRLEKKQDKIVLIAPKSGTDYTDKMIDYSEKKVEALSQMNLCGVILKKDSPTCGMERVKVYDPNKIPDKAGVGIFARILMDRFPLIPVEEEGRLNDIRLREHFVERVFAIDRIKRFIITLPDPGKLMVFHARHKMQLMVHHPQKYRLLGSKVAAVREMDKEKFLHEYQESYMEIMQHMPTIKKHTDVLYHLLGFFKNKITPEDKQEFIELVEQYRLGQIPIIVPLTMINHYLKKYPVDWLASQTYLEPYPRELMLRSYL
jgi:uncharacterized protein YbgA (DUF1722 family)/uncharacterized protein YbbK (DUF523 family)